jgi:peptide/nickel transport system permease protein
VPRLVPGDPLNTILTELSRAGSNSGSPELIEEYRRMFGMDRSIWEQYVSFLRELLRGNLGYSISSFPSQVTDLIRFALPWTIGLLTITTVLSWVLGTVIGAVVGWRGSKSRFFQGLVPIALVLYATPYYILAIILIFLFAFNWRIFPLSGAYSTSSVPNFSLNFILDVLRHGALPALSIVLVSLGWWFLSMRSLITSLKGEDYILNAEAMGLQERRILWGYAFRNALLPQATGLAISLGHIVSGAIITEVLFAYPGLGWLIFNSITRFDFPVIQGSVLLIVFSVAVANFILDISYPLIDPRIRYEASEVDSMTLFLTRAYQEASRPASDLFSCFTTRSLMLACHLLLALAPLVAGAFVDPAQRSTGSLPPRLPPSSEAPLGTDTLGRSVFVQMTEAVPNSLQVGLIAATLGTLLGAIVGFISGYFGGILDTLLRILIDVFLSVPSLLFLILITSIVRGVGVQAMAIIIGLFAWSWPARQVRAQVLSLKERSFVEIARLSGMSGLEIIFRELMPHMIPWLGANFVNAFIAAILAESGLSILGLGPQGQMTLGMMIYWSTINTSALLQNLWWWWTTPVIALMLFFLSLYLIHLGLDEISNPRLRSAT